MSQAPGRPAGAAGGPEPTWEVAYLFPPQGGWSEEEYLALRGNRLVEFSDGSLEVLPLPTTSHQLLVAYLYGLLLAFVGSRNLGTVLFAPLRVRLWAGKFREPDVVFMAKEHAGRIGEEFWDGADLVMEVVSDDEEDRRRDLQTKRREYARAGIPEYWIIDPREGQITVLRLAGKRYAVHGQFSRGTAATSRLLAGFTVDVSEALSRRVGSAAEGKRRPRRSR
ncbi:MAG TPA: Uma2 family endonuclease [Gemmataceae bacterium]|nr:Uma2 family endonuclease [Gemmataceae bacterium]